MNPKSAATIVAFSFMATIGLMSSRTIPDTDVEAPHEQCVAQASAYFGKVEISEPVKILIEESRKFFPDQIEMISSMIKHDNKASKDYLDAMQERGVQEGCEDILSHIYFMLQSVPCYANLGIDSSTATLELVKSSEAARNVIEAHLACQAAASLIQEY